LIFSAQTVLVSLFQIVDATIRNTTPRMIFQLYNNIWQAIADVQS